MKDNEKILYMKTSELFKTISKCSAKQVCCLLVKNDNIISIGVNGTQKGSVNCNELFHKDRNGNWYKIENGEYKEIDNKQHNKWSLLHETHAEINALSKANKNGVNVEGSSAFITYSPCFNCAKTLITFGIKEIYFKEKYDDYEEVFMFLKENKIHVERIEI